MQRSSLPLTSPVAAGNPRHPRLAWQAVALVGSEPTTSSLIAGIITESDSLWHHVALCDLNSQPLPWRLTLSSRLALASISSCRLCSVSAGWGVPVPAVLTVSSFPFYTPHSLVTPHTLTALAHTWVCTHSPIWPSYSTLRQLHIAISHSTKPFCDNAVMSPSKTHHSSSVSFPK